MVLCICIGYHSSGHLVGAQDVSAEVLLAEAEAVVLGSASREPGASYACPSPWAAPALSSIRRSHPNFHSCHGPLGEGRTNKES